MPSTWSWHKLWFKGKTQPPANWNKPQDTRHAWRHCSATDRGRPLGGPHLSLHATSTTTASAAHKQQVLLSMVPLNNTPAQFSALQ